MAIEKHYIYKPSYKAIAHFGPLNGPLLKRWAPIALFWGGSIVSAVLLFGESIPRVKDEIFRPIPIIGSHWYKPVDKEDTYL